jgi:hypothetical protein
LLGLLVFVAAGLVAFSRLNIEAYPNPAPVILEITAQAAGLSAEEMERYYTIPMEIGLYPTPGIDNIRSTSFYGLTFVRVTFRYGVDFFFARHQFAGPQAFKNLAVAVVLIANHDRAPREMPAIGGNPDGLRAVALAHDAGEPNRGRANRRAGTDDKVAEHSRAQFVLRVLDLGPYQNAASVGIDAGADRHDLALVDAVWKGA